MLVELLVVVVTCGRHQGVEADARPVLLQLHHVHPAGRDPPGQPLPQLHTAAVGGGIHTSSSNTVAFAT